MKASAQVVIFCPLPPKPNGIADYLAEQLPYFSDHLDVIVVVENNSPDPIGICQQTSVIRMAEYLSQWDKFSCVPHVYHVGNNSDTVYMLEVLLLRPGITIIHDLNLNYLIDLTNLSKGDKPAYTKALRNLYGYQGKIIGEQMESLGWKGNFQAQELMMHSSIIDASSQVIVHSKYSKQKIEALGHKRVSLIPHHLSPATRSFQPKLKMKYRGELGLPGNKVVITSMGFIAKAKQIKAVLNSLKKLKAERDDFIYVLAGQCKPHEYDVYQDIAESGLKENVFVTGFLEENDFFKYLLASDFIINLRYPTGGESSGTLSRAMGLGLGCIVVNIGPFSEIPDGCAIKLNYDDTFEFNLFNAIKDLVRSPIKRATLGLHAKRWVERSHNIKKTTERYRELIQVESRLVKKRLRPSSPLPYKIWRYLLRRNISDWLIKNHDWVRELNTQITGALWWLNNTLPVQIDGPVLFVGDTSNSEKLITELFGYTQKFMYKFDALELENLDVAMLPVQTVNFALLVIPVTVIEADPVRYFARLNRFLAIGAKVSLTIQLSVDANPDVPLNRSDLKIYLEASGFEINKVHLGTNQVDMQNNLPEIKHEEWCFELTKLSWMVNKTPIGYGFNGISELTYLQPLLSFGNGRGMN